MNEKKLYFSLLSGEIYQVEADEVANLDKYQIPLLKRPSQSCRKCYGRMHIGYDTKLRIYTLCQPCTNRCVDFKTFKANEIEIESPKDVTENPPALS